MPNIVTRYGVLEAFDPNTDLICHVLTKYGEWAQHEVRFVAGAIHDGARVADVGAFLGTFSLGLAQLRRLESVCLVEANQATVPALRANVERNLPAKGVVVEAVVGQERHEYSGTVLPENAGSFSLAVANGDGRVAASSVEATTSLAELDRGYGPFDLVKIDTEGMEYEILSSSLDYLASTRTAFWVECNEAPSSLAVAELFLSQGFQLLYCAFPALSSDNFNHEREIDYPFAYESGMWATRGQAPTLSPELKAAGCTLTAVRSVDELRDAMWLTPRWAPKDWLFHTREEIVALATHALLGEDKPGYLKDPIYREGNRDWARPLPKRLEDELDASKKALNDQIDTSQRALQDLNGELVAAKNLERAAQILLFSERERAKLAVGALEDGLRVLQDQLAEAHRVQRASADDGIRAVIAMQNSTSWRITRPLRVLSRLLHGDWAELRRIAAARRANRH